MLVHWLKWLGGNVQEAGYLDHNNAGHSPANSWIEVGLSDACQILLAWRAPTTPQLQARFLALGSMCRIRRRRYPSGMAGNCQNES
ncbi:hypothetical protein BAUCODRAFT_28824 [Baudoinia panamericana UAMH 10762]|uniref:Uncharacterized protein n=1 Tax=Baudoinia panamericana (strain UAMH 10762) TaxID=717646 RepID=M2NMQ1_BAUPA|nr:uncharacterized protein BAUCODRAFT_28824 [Baudoinia panamericana UAMH 10762]EMD00466.1 hypothetical protein BAUCODRAFT_28824 [Baudoinia panamericana UAMH 10762]